MYQNSIKMVSVFSYTVIKFLKKLLAWPVAYIWLSFEIFKKVLRNGMFIPVPRWQIMSIVTGLSKQILPDSGIYFFFFFNDCKKWYVFF